MTYHSDRSRVCNSSFKLFARAPILGNAGETEPLPSRDRRT